MKIFGPTPIRRLNEAGGIVFLFAAVALTLSLISYHPEDPSFNFAGPVPEIMNVVGYVGAHFADLLLQSLGLSAYLLPCFLLVLSWKWLRSTPVELQWVRLAGGVLLFTGVSTLLGLASGWFLYESRIPAGGLAGTLLARIFVSGFNVIGSSLIALMCLVLSLYLLTSFSIAQLSLWIPGGIFERLRGRVSAWLAEQRRRREERRRAEAAKQGQPAPEDTPAFLRRRSEVLTEASGEDDYEIPIRTLDETEEYAREEAALAAASAPPGAPAGANGPDPDPPVVDYVPPAPASRPPWEEPLPAKTAAKPALPKYVDFRLPPTALLNPPDAKPPYDTAELKETAARIRSKFEEFNVLGTVTQINPGPVVTTFEFKPEAGIKYSRITTLSEDLCLGLQAESILIERIPGKPTVGIEVPNSRREVISLRQIIESDEFQSAPSKLTIALGKDISGRIRVASLESMPHLLIAGSTGSGKSVMLNSLIMSVLYKATPHDVRMILVDPKRVEMGVYENVPHLLTPVITDARKANNALRNAVIEMERRLKLLASHGVRNIEQYNRKIRQLMNEPRSLFEEENEIGEDLQPLSYVLIVIDELADLMMIDRGNVEESITRLAQMARAVGMHLVVATQRPSVDVISGLIKANFPARVSFRVATRVDSRTILDVMGAEHLLGKGDMLFLPPGSSRLVRVHAPYVGESEIHEVTKHWKDQAAPAYDQSYLSAPPEDGEEGEQDDFEDFHDPMYQDAVRVVVEVGKASTSTLQRRLRLGYGRAARILDKMHHEGIIGPPDGSRPREVLKKPEWLDEIESTANPA